jgi:hypothetical protein
LRAQKCSWQENIPQILCGQNLDHTTKLKSGENEKIEKSRTESGVRDWLSKEASATTPVNGGVWSPNSAGCCWWPLPDLEGVVKTDHGIM